MKRLGKISLVAVSAVFLLGCTACGTDPAATAGKLAADVAGNPAYETPAVETYDNKEFNEYLMGDDVAIKDQWTGYGIGDPFAMRWNGAYYLYFSTLNGQVGVRGYRSDDLVHWEKLTGEGLTEGYVSEDPLSDTAFAPEVYYFNGTFYMYTSPGGGGHRVFTAPAPEGPFTAATDNFHLDIDGSVFIDDNEDMYFMFAGQSGIRMARMKNMLEVDATSAPTLQDTSIGGWTEGPGMFKRDGTYYLTYTGNNVISDGYRIAYSTATDLTGRYAQSFTRGQNNPIALATGTALKGIGHSSNVLGPDMDSYYLVYHYLNSSGGPNRSLGIDRLTFNGKMMSVRPTLEKSVKPALPAFYTTGRSEDKLETAGDFLLSKTSSGANFTAEYNVTGPAISTYVFSYTDANNYCGVTVDLTAKTITLNKTAGGTTSAVASGTLKNDFAADKLHTVRVSARDGAVDVVFDNMTKIDNAKLETAAGKVGYKGLSADAQLGYTAYSNVAMGMSDELEAKNISSYIGASTYLKDGTYTEKPVLGSSSGIYTITEDEDARLEGWKAMKLGAEGDRVSYLVYAPTAGRYALDLVYRVADGGKKLGVKVDGVNGGTVWRCTLPELPEGFDYAKSSVAEFELTAGVHIVRLECLGSEIAYAALGFSPTAATLPKYSQPLDTYAATGSDYKTIWKIKDGGHYAKAGTRQLVYFGDDTITDFTLETEIKLEGESGSSTAGIVFRAQNYAASPYDTYMSITGYYLSLQNDGLQLERLNFADDTSVLDADMRTKIDSDVYYKLKVQMHGCNIKVWLNGEQIFDYSDSWVFTNGSVGLYTNGAAAVYKNLRIGA